MSTLFDDVNDPSLSDVVGSAGMAEPAKKKPKPTAKKIINNNLRRASFTLKSGQRVLPGQSVKLPKKEAAALVKAGLADYAD